MSKSTRELVTIQVGHYANFVGTHWWNLQEASFVYDSTITTDINHDFLFREGLTSQRQETYTPRLLSVDVQGNLHSLPARGSLYCPLRSHPSTNEAAWEESVDLIHQLPQEKNQYLMDLEQEDERYSQPTDEDKDVCVDDSSISNKSEDNSAASSQKIYDLSKSVRVWSDFLRPHLHPDAIYLLNSLLVYGGRGVAGEGEGDLWGFPSGAALFHREEVEEEITDRIRLLAESCNSLQGFQLLSDVHNGMGGVSYGILQHFADDYGSKDSITFAISPPHLYPSTPQARMMTQAAILQSYSELSQLSSVLVPLCLRKSITDLTAPCVSFPSLTFQEDNAYLSSSILGAFLETASTAYRTCTSPLPLAAVTQNLTPAGRKVVGASFALPYGRNWDESGVELDETEKGHGMMPLSAGASLALSPISEVRTIRGFPAAKMSREDIKSPLASCCVRASDSLKTTPPFPAIFTRVDPTLDQLAASRHTTRVKRTKPAKVVQEGVWSVGSLGVLHQGSGMGQVLQPALSTAQRLDVTKVPPLLDEGLDKDAWSGVVEALQSLVLDYCLENEEMDCSDDD